MKYVGEDDFVYVVCDGCGHLATSAGEVTSSVGDAAKMERIGDAYALSAAMGKGYSVMRLYLRPDDAEKEK